MAQELKLFVGTSVAEPTMWMVAIWPAHGKLSQRINNYIVIFVLDTATLYFKRLPLSTLDLGTVHYSQRVWYSREIFSSPKNLLSLLKW